MADIASNLKPPPSFWQHVRMVAAAFDDTDTLGELSWWIMTPNNSGDTVMELSSE
jgi:hypothetical protein